MSTAQWVGAAIPVKLVSTSKWDIGTVPCAKTSSIADYGENWGKEGIKKAVSISSIPREKLSSELIVKEASSCSTAADVAEIRVTCEDGYGWCGGCVKLMGEVSELKEARQRDNVMLAVGELVSIVYEKIFEIANDIGLPEVLGRRGQSVAIDLSLFLKYTKTKNEFKALLDAALKEIGLTREEYDILVAAKRARNHAYHPTDTLESLEILRTAPVDDFSAARNVLLTHRTLFMDDIDECTPTDDK